MINVIKIQNNSALNGEDTRLVFGPDLNQPCPGVVPLHLSQGEPEVPGHDVGPAGRPVIPLQVLQVAEEDCVHCRGVHREQHTEQSEQNIAVERKLVIFYLAVM